MGNVPWDGVRWDRHKLLWDGTDKYVSWTTLKILQLATVNVGVEANLN